MFIFVRDYVKTQPTEGEIDFFFKLLAHLV